MQTRIVKQANLSSECWNIQIWGIDTCDKCKFRGRRACGGKQIRKTLLNNKGIKVPI